MTTTEKRAELAANGELWPDCECHGEPKAWQRDLKLSQGGWFHCRVTRREWQKTRRTLRRQNGECVHCGLPAVTATLCRLHADQHSDFMAQTKQQLLHRAHDRAFDARRKSDEFQPTGVGRAAFAAYMTGNLPGR